MTGPEDGRSGRTRAVLREAGHERALSRLSAEFVLRALHSVAKAYDGDLILAMVAVEMVAANTGHLAMAPADAYASYDHPVPDAVRRPVSALAIAGALGIPRETARRHVKKLVSLGYCQKVRGGYIIPAEILASEANLEVMRENAINLRRLIERLQDQDYLV